MTNWIRHVFIFILAVITLTSSAPLSSFAQNSTAEAGMTVELPTENMTPAELPALGGMVLSELPGLADLPFGQVTVLSGLADQPGFTFLKDVPNLKNLPLKNVPGLKDLPIKDIPGLKDLPIKDIPGLKDVPVGQIPGLRDIPGFKNIPGIGTVKASQVSDFFNSIDFIFGGEILKKSFRICIFSYFPPVMFPLQYVEVLEVGEPNPAPNEQPRIEKLYRLFFISKLFRRNRLERTSLAMGLSVPGGRQFRDLFCRKKPRPPEASSLIWTVGTSCKEGERPGFRCKN